MSAQIHVQEEEVTRSTAELQDRTNQRSGPSVGLQNQTKLHTYVYQGTEPNFSTSMLLSKRRIDE